MSKNFIPAFALLLVCVVSGCQPTESADATGNEADTAVSAPAAAESVDEAVVVATLGDRSLTMDELDDFIKDGLFASQSGNGNAAQLYEMRSKAIGPFIEQTIVVDAANAAGLTVEQYLDKVVVSESEIPQAEVEAFYEANKDKIGDATLEEITPKIRSHLRSQRATEYVAKLRAEANPEILLEPARVEVAASGPSHGPADAPVTIIEFSDFQCPYCKRVVPTLKEVAEKYPDQVRIVFRHLPLERIHNRAIPAAEAAACAQKQDLFWPFHDILFENNRKLEDEDLAKYAADAGLDVPAFEKCVADREFQAAVQTDADAAAELGLRGTPAFFINGIPMRGAKPLEEFVRIIDAELEREPTSNG